jgi:hypothetical protein
MARTNNSQVVPASKITQQAAEEIRPPLAHFFQLHYFIESRGTPSWRHLRLARLRPAVRPRPEKL